MYLSNTTSGPLFEWLTPSGGETTCQPYLKNVKYLAKIKEII